MPKIKVKPVEQITRKPVSYAYDAFMRHCQLKNLAPYSYLYYNKNTQYFLDGMSNVAVDSDRAVIMKQSSRLWMQVEKSVKTKKQNWSSTA